LVRWVGGGKKVDVMVKNYRIELFGAVTNRLKREAPVKGTAPVEKGTPRSQGVEKSRGISFSVCPDKTAKFVVLPQARSARKGESRFTGSAGWPGVGVVEGTTKRGTLNVSRGRA